MTVHQLIEMLNDRGSDFDILGPADVRLAMSYCSSRYTHIIVLQDSLETCYLIEGTAKEPSGEPDYFMEDEVVEFAF